MKGLFVFGTDTGVGKTFVCGLLLSACVGEGIAVRYQKLVSTGRLDGADDLLACRLALGDRSEPHPAQSPYCFGKPASPHLAAELENREIDPAVLRQAMASLAADSAFLIVEGVGGCLVPLRRDLLLADFAATTGLPALLVARSGLGTLNHTLLSLEALRHRQIPVAGVVFSDEKEHEDDIIVQDNMTTIAQIGKIRVFGRAPRTASFEAARAAFAPIGREIVAAVQGIGIPEK